MASGQHSQHRKPFKCIVIGDACVGKTWLVCRLAEKPLDENYTPTIVENQLIVRLYNGQQCRLDIWDTAGQEDYEGLRINTYDGVDLVLICFGLSDRNSFDNLENVWLPEMNKYKASARVLLVGTKLDLYRPEEAGSVPRGAIDALKAKYGYPYTECSSLTQYGIPELLQQTLAVLHSDSQNRGRRNKPNIRGKCAIL